MTREPRTSLKSTPVLAEQVGRKTAPSPADAGRLPAAGTDAGALPGGPRPWPDQTVESRFRALVERLPGIVYTLAPDEPLTLTYISPQVAAILGYSPAEILAGQPDFMDSGIHPEERADVRRAVERTRVSGEPFREEYRVQARDGRWLWLRDEAALIRDDAGQPLLWQGVLLDITSERMADVRQRAAERRYRELFDDAPVMYVVTRSEAGEPIIADCNATFLTTLGYARDEVIGRSLAEFYAPRSRATLLAGSYRTSLDLGLPPTERQLVAHGGKIVDALVLARPETALDGSPTGTRVTMVDITERKAAQVALRAGEQRFRALIQNGQDIVSVLDRSGTITYVSPSIVRRLGYDPEQRLERRAVEIVHPDDRAKLEEAIAACVDGAQQVAPFELRIRHHDGSWRDFEVVGTNLMAEPSVAGIVFNSWDVTARKAAEAAHRESEARFQHAFDHAASGMALVARHGRFLQVNHALGQILGYSIDELLGMTLPAVTVAADRDIDRVQLQQVEDGEIADYQVEKRLLHKSGEEIRGRLSISLVRDSAGDPLYAVVQVQDITPFKAAGEALRASEERFRSAFDHAPIGMALVDRDGTFMQVNHALCEIVGYAKDELQGTTFQAITHPEDLGDDLKFANQLWAGEIDTYQMEKRYIHKDGHRVWIHLTSSVVRDDDKPKYAIAQIIDITERRHLELERATILASEREYTRQLRALSAMRADLTAMIAHELRAPVSALGMMTSLLETLELTPQDESDMFVTVRAEIDRLNRLIDDVAAVTVAESEDFSVEMHSVPLAILVEAGVTYARTALAGHAFVVREAPAVRVWCDPERIVQVVRNLLDNVGKHTPAGTPVELRARHDGQHVSIEIADRGPGLSAEEVSLIFEKFGRGYRAAATQVSGAGLGLYLSRRILLAHGTDLSVVAAPGEGTAVSFALEIAS